MNKQTKEICMDEDFDILHKCVKAYNHDVLNAIGAKKWTERDTRDFLNIDENDKFFWTLYSCIIETKIKYGITNF